MFDNGSYVAGAGDESTPLGGLGAHQNGEAAPHSLFARTPPVGS